MKIKFLGTGGVCGIPEWNCSCKVCRSKNPKDKRLRPCILVQIGNKNIAIDFGPDFRQQLLKYKIKKLDYAFLTHAHGDHMNGYAELSRQDNCILESPRKVLNEFFRRLGSNRKWLRQRNPTIKVQPFKKKKIAGVEINTVALKHQKDYEKAYFPCYGFVFRTKKSVFAYLSDFTEIIELEKLRGASVLVLDGCGISKIGIGHLSLDDIIKLLKLIKPRRVLLTHINHLAGTHASLTKFLKKWNIEIAYDGMELDIK